MSECCQCCQRTEGCCQRFRNCLVRFFCWLVEFFCCTRQRHRGYDTLDGSSNSSNNEAQHLREENEVLKERIFHYQEQLQLLKQSKDEALYSLNNEAQHLREEIAVLNQRIAGYEEQVQLLNRSKDEALSRLSEMMGNKLRDNNPAITDLNDPNRPMKLGEQFKAIYENEWTDAFTILEEDDDNKMTETQRIKVLLDILKEINEVSTNESLQQMSGIKQAVQNIPEEDSKEYLKSFKDTLKSQATRFITLLFKKIISDDSQCMTTLKYRGLFEPYIQKSVSVCYYAAVQDPPMFLDFEPAVEFDKHAFNVYTRSGTLVDFIVWPALLIQPGGGIISKGIVQPREETN